MVSTEFFKSIYPYISGVIQSCIPKFSTTSHISLPMEVQSNLV